MLTAWPAIIVCSGSESLVSGSDLDQLEASGSFESAYQLLRAALRSGPGGRARRRGLASPGPPVPTAEPQRIEAERAYHLSFAINRAPLTLNNLAVLRMGALDYAAADHWLSAGLALPGIQPQERSLLLNSACELRLVPASAIGGEEVWLRSKLVARSAQSSCQLVSFIKSSK